VEVVRTSGYRHLKEPITTALYESVVGAIGQLVSRSDIKIDMDRYGVQQETRTVKGRPSAYQADGLAFHSDNPRVDMLAWHCVEQDESDGAILLLDTSDIGEHVPEEHLKVLSKVELWFSDRILDTEQEVLTAIPVLSGDNAGWRVYYQPWLLRDSYDLASSEALEQLRQYLRRKEESQLIRISIKKNECVFIDNHRMLHGRGAIAERSRRHLLRFFIRVPAVRG
jgi:hypothetical protein